MANIKEYKTIDDYITDGSQKKLKEWQEQEEYYKKISREAMKSYFYYAHSYIEYYYQNIKSKQEELADFSFGGQEDKRIIVSDRLTGGFLLNDDELLDDNLINEFLIKNYKCMGNILADVYKDRHQFSERIIRIIEDVPNSHPFSDLTTIRVDEEENKKLKKEHRYSIISVSNESGEFSNFSKNAFDGFKMLGSDSKILVCTLPEKPMIYGESKKGKGLIMGLKN